MIEKLKSRKLWMAVLGAVAQIVLPAVGIPVEIVSQVGHLVMVYLGAQGIADAAGAFQSQP